MSRRRASKQDNAHHTDSTLDGTARPLVQANKVAAAQVAVSLMDYSLMISLVLGGCCTNVWAYERLLRIESRVGSALTFSQMLFITLQQLPSFIIWKPSAGLLPRLKPRQVPLSQWLLQVVVLATGSLFNNWVYAFHVPLTIQIVFRSAGLAVSMLFGRFFMHKRYSIQQVTAVLLVSIGVVVATLSRPPSADQSTENLFEYALGVTMLTVSLALTGTLGMLQERTYQKYGPCWKEGVFYTHALSLPVFLFLIPQVKHGLGSLSEKSDSVVPMPYVILAANLLSQLVCVSGVNQLSSRVSSVSTQVVLTTRKAISLCFSVWWFGNGWNGQLGLGAGMVFVGSFWYTQINTDGRTGTGKKE